MKLAEEGGHPGVPGTARRMSDAEDPCEIAGGDGGDVLGGRCAVISWTGADMTEKFIKAHMKP